MKCIVICLITLLLVGCNTPQKVFKGNRWTDANNMSVQEYVWSIIIYNENQLDRLEKGKKTYFQKGEELKALSNIASVPWDGACYTSEIYQPTRKDIILWKNWFQEQKDFLSFDKDNNYLKLLDSLGIKQNNKIVVWESSTGEIRNSWGGKDSIYHSQWRNIHQ